MRKLILFLTALFLFLAAGCADSFSDTLLTVLEKPTPSLYVNTEETEGRVTFEPWEDYEDVLPMVCFDMPSWDTYLEVVKETPYCVVGTVKDIEIIELGTQQFEPLYDTTVKYTVHVNKYVNGIFAEGQTIYVQQNGYRYGDINIYHKYWPPLDYDKQYLMSLRNSEEGQDIFRFGTPFSAYPEIIDSKLHLYEYSSMFYERQPVEEVIVEMQAALASIQPVYISMEEGVKEISEWLSDYETGYAPVRDLTIGELAKFYDFDGSDFVVSAAGKELENGYRFVWVETTELDKFQMEQFSDDLSRTAIAMAEGEIKGIVSVKPYATLITLIRGNEDSGSVHVKFSGMLSREEYKEKEWFQPWEAYENELEPIEITLPEYESISDLIEDSDMIFTATLDDIEVDAVGASYPYKTKIEYIVCYQKGYKDEFDHEEGSKFRIYQKGIRYGRLNIYLSDMPPLEYGKTYLIFINNDYITSFETYPEVIDGKIYPQGESGIFYEGMTMEEVFTEG